MTTKKIKAKAVKEEGKPLKHGRPSVYSRELADLIVDRMQRESLNKICKEDGMPDESTVRGWALDNKDEFFPKYMRAMQIRALSISEEIIDIADDAKNDTYLDEDGNERTNTEVVARSRLKTDVRKWYVCKMVPKIFGDKIDVNHGVQPDNPLAKLIEQVSGTSLSVKKQSDE